MLRGIAQLAIMKPVGVDGEEASNVFLNGRPRIFLNTTPPSCAIRLLPDASDRFADWMIPYPWTPFSPPCPKRPRKT